jgi:Helix-turn-helix domain/RodZ C-terminal domain
MFEIGASLREARLKRGLSPADVQKAIRIRDRYLQALEEERWEQLPGDAYVKGFLRTYADFLGLDGNLYVDEYNNRFAQPEEQLLVPQRFRRAETHRRRTALLRPALAVATLVAVVAAVAAWQLGGSGSPSTKQGTRSTSVPTTTGSTTPKKHRKHHPSPPPVALASQAVLVASRGACWLEVRQGSASGALIYENTLQQGQTLPVKLTSGPVWIRIGDPPKLDIRLGGKLVPGLPSQAGNVLLTRSGLKPA